MQTKEEIHAAIRAEIEALKWLAARHPDDEGIQRCIDAQRCALEWVLALKPAAPVKEGHQ